MKQKLLILPFITTLSLSGCSWAGNLSLWDLFLPVIKPIFIGLSAMWFMQGFFMYLKTKSPDMLFMIIFFGAILLYNTPPLIHGILNYKSSEILKKEKRWQAREDTLLKSVRTEDGNRIINNTIKLKEIK